MSNNLRGSVSLIKDIVSLIKELKPVFIFINQGRELTQSQVDNIRLFSYYFMTVFFLMSMLASITLMLIKLPLVGASFDSDIMYKISNTAKSFMDMLWLIGYLIILGVLNVAFLMVMTRIAKKIFNDFLKR